MNPPTHPRHRQPLLTAIILVFLALTLWAVDQARRKVSPVIDREYYAHGLTFNQTELEQTAANTRGWTLKMRIAGPSLETFLSDGSGRPVTGAKGDLVILGSHSGANPPLGLPLREQDRGHYLASLPEGLSGQGQVQAQVSFSLDGARIHRTMMLNF